MDKDISVIPEGLYCYTRLDVDSNVSRQFKIRVCPYWEKKEGACYENKSH